MENAVRNENPVRQNTNGQNAKVKLDSKEFVQNLLDELSHALETIKELRDKNKALHEEIDEFKLRALKKSAEYNLDISTSASKIKNLEAKVSIYAGHLANMLAQVERHFENELTKFYCMEDAAEYIDAATFAETHGRKEGIIIHVQNWMDQV